VRALELLRRPSLHNCPDLLLRKYRKRRELRAPITERDNRIEKADGGASSFSLDGKTSLAHPMQAVQHSVRKITAPVTYVVDQGRDMRGAVHDLKDDYRSARAKVSRGKSFVTGKTGSLGGSTRSVR
jgi:hypothetical protein